MLHKITIIIDKYIKELKWKYSEYKVRKQAKSVREGLRVHGPSTVTGNTVLGKCVAFNGMTIRGGGKVRIGKYFHSGTGCMMITDVHNYDGVQKFLMIASTL